MLESSPNGAAAADEAVAGREDQGGVATQPASNARHESALESVISGVGRALAGCLLRSKHADESGRLRSASEMAGLPLHEPSRDMAAFDESTPESSHRVT
jgi:hypothetical protein